MTLAKYPASTV